MRTSLILVCSLALAVVTAGSAAATRNAPQRPVPAKHGSVAYADGTRIAWRVHRVSSAAAVRAGLLSARQLARTAAVYCWGATLTVNNFNGPGIEYENWNPRWCGNTSVLTSVDRSDHHPFTIGFNTSTQSEYGPSTYSGCASGCGNEVSWIVARFTVSYKAVSYEDQLAMCINVTGNGAFAAWKGSNLGGC